MKKTFLLGIMICLSVIAFAQRSVEWYSYWGSNIAGNQIEPKRMIVDANGNIYVAANFGGNKVSAEGRTLVSQSSIDKGDAVIIKMNESKTVLWAYNVVSSGKASVSDLALDANGNLIVLGTFNQTIKVGGNTMTLDDSNLGEEGVYVLKLSESGQGLAAWQISALGAKSGNAVIDSQNNIIIAGLLDGDATFIEGGAVEGDYRRNAQLFVAKYDNNGNLLWHNFTNDGVNTSTYGVPSMALDANDNIYVSTSNYGNALLLALNSTGAEQWRRTIGGTGELTDDGGPIAVSPIGEVCIVVNHHSNNLYVDNLTEEFSNGYAYDGTQFVHAGFFSFDLAGEFKWYFDWGYSNNTSGSDAPCYSLRCTDEGVWYATGMMTGRYGSTRISAIEEERTLPNGRNSGVETIDNEWLQHNTNGGNDCYLITLTRKGKLVNAVRPGGPQYEIGTDMALTPDKKSIYWLWHVNVRNNVPYTCPDNLFDSWTDLYAPSVWASRKSQYTLLKVFCPENTDASATNYTEAYKAIFSSAMLLKLELPEINPNNLPFFQVGQAYAQHIDLNYVEGTAKLFQLESSEDITFNDNNISGTFMDANDRYFGVIGLDKIPNPGQIAYYEYDQTTQKSQRSQPRTCRYMPLREGQNTALDEVSLDAAIYPTVCRDNINIRCEEKNYTVNIYTMDGRMIFSHDNVTVIGLGGRLPAGMYQVEVRAGKARRVETIIVQ